MPHFLISVSLVDDVEDSDGLPSLEKPGWYSQGNWPHLHELLKNMTNKSNPKVGQHFLLICKVRSQHSCVMQSFRGMTATGLCVFVWKGSSGFMVAVAF